MLQKEESLQAALARRVDIAAVHMYTRLNIYHAAPAQLITCK